MTIKKKRPEESKSPVVIKKNRIKKGSGNIIAGTVTVDGGLATGADGPLKKPDAKQISKSRIAVGVFVAVVLAVTTKFITSYVEEKWGILNEPYAMISVVVVFLVTVVVSIALEIKKAQ